MYMSNELTTLSKFELLLKSDDVSQVFQTSSFKMNVSREIQFALQILQNNTYLQGATPESIKNAIVNVALTGLSLNPVLNQAYLVPRKKNGVLIAVLDPSYQGLITKMIDFGVALKVVANVVHANDQFDFDEATDSMLVPHKKHYMLGIAESGVEIGAYAGIQHPNGSWQYKFLPIKRVNQIMETSESYKAGIRDNKDSIWTGIHRDEMIKKTLVKYLWKYLPKSEQIEAIGKAIEESNFAHESTTTTYVGEKTIQTKQPSNSIANEATSKVKPPVSRTQKIEEAKIAVDAKKLEMFEVLLNDNYVIEMGQARTSEQVEEIKAALNELVDISVLDNYLSLKSRAYKTANALFERGLVDQIMMVLRNVVSVS